MTNRILVRGGWVLPMTAGSRPFRGDVLIEDDAIAAVGTLGEDVDAALTDVETVDATDRIVLPGLVDTHRHMWQSALRGIACDRTLGEYFARMRGRLGGHFRPEDTYAGTLLGAVEALDAGITTVVDWSHAGDDIVLAEAALAAHRDAGTRTVFVDTGGADGLSERVSRLKEAAGPSTTIAFGRTAPAGAALDAAAADWAAARELGLRIHVHGGANGIAPVAGLLRDDVTVVHGSSVQPSDVDAIASSGAAVSIAPLSEMAGGLGAPPIQPLIDREVRPGLAVDDERVSPGDLFAQMRAAISMQHATVFDLKLAGKGGVPKLMTTRNVIRYATSAGAAAAGLGGGTGTLEAGMKADVLVLRADRPNIYPINDPIGAVVWGMDTSNVDRVFVGGRALVRGGELDADVTGVRSLATAARARVGDATGSIVGAARGGGG